MATGGEVKLGHSIEKTSDIVYDYACTLCVQIKGSFSEATNYCPECDVYYCGPCLLNICDHGSLGKAKMEKWGKPTCKKRGQPCTDHTGNLIQLYCGNDNEVGCHVCIAEKHRRCTRMMHIPVMVSKKETRQHLQAVQQVLGEMKSMLIDAKQDRVERKKNLQTTYNSLKTEIHEFRRKMSELLEVLEKQSINDLNELERTINDQLSLRSQTCDRVQKEMELLQDKLETSGADDTDFIWWKQNNIMLEEVKKIVSEANITSCDAPIRFDFHTEIEESLKNLRGLGKITDQPEEHQVNRPYIMQRIQHFSIRDQKDA